ncbi:hypothetical protein D3C80_1213500 [compost metagenome]
MQPGGYRFPAWRIRCQGFFITAGPALDLALHVALRLAQVGQAAGGVVHLVQLDQAVDEAFAQGFGPASVQVKFGRDVRAQDDALDPFHHIELAADQAGVGAVCIGLGAVREAAVQLVEDAVLATHVVGRLGLLTEGWSTQHEVAARVADQVGEVGGAARKLADARQAVQAGDIGFEVRVDDGRVEFFAGAYLGGLVGERHASSLFSIASTIG